MSYENKGIWKELNKILSVIPQKYIVAISSLHEKLDGKNIFWALNGDVAEALKTIQTDPEFIEILCSQQDAEQIFEQIQEFHPKQISFQTQQLPRNAVINGSEYPIYARSYFFEFDLNEVTVKVHGDLQYKLDDWEWGDILSFEPEYVYVVGNKTAVTPLTIAYELYSNLGWVDKTEKIRQVLMKINGGKIK
jgi:hypothetical protein